MVLAVQTYGLMISYLCQVQNKGFHTFVPDIFVDQISLDLKLIFCWSIIFDTWRDMKSLPFFVDQDFLWETHSNIVNIRYHKDCM